MTLRAICSRPYLAAPQIGVPYRIFVMEDTEEGMSDVEEAVRTPSLSRHTLDTLSTYYRCTLSRR